MTEVFPLSSLIGHTPRTRLPPFVFLFRYPNRTVVVFDIDAFRCLSFLGFEEVVHFVFPFLFWSFYGSVCLPSFPIFLLVVMLFSSPISASFFHACRSNMGSWLHSFFLLLQLYFFSCIQSSPLAQALLCQSLYLNLWRRRRRCLGRNGCLYCFLLEYRLRSSLGYLCLLRRLFFIFRLLVIFFLVPPSSLYDEPEYFALCRTYYSFVIAR